MFMKAVRDETIQMEEYEELASGWLNMTRESAAPRTTGRRLVSLRGFARWAGYPNVLLEYSAPRAGRGIPHPLREGKDGIQRLIKACRNPQEAALIGLMGFGSCRVSEALSITVKSFDIDGMILTIRGKGDKTRLIPVSVDLWESTQRAYLDAAMREDQHLILTKNRSARKAVTRIGVKAGISRAISSHDLRMTFGTEVFDKTSNLRVTQELLGHASSNTTELYTGVTLKKMKEAVEF